VGDNLIHREVIASGKQSDGTYQYDFLYSNLKEEISAADIAVVNQETIFGGKEKGYSGYPKFNSPTEIGDALVDTGFDVVLQATNHAMDMGSEGIANTLAYWKDKPQITVLGINESEEASEKVTILEKNGIRIAMLNYTFSLNGIPLPKDKPYLVNMLDQEKMARDLQFANKNADFTMVYPHWGTEYVYKSIDMQKDLTKFFYEQGVDLVIGSHPHVIEPVEWIETEKGHRMLVYYSLGNFLSYQREAPRMLGAMAEVTIVKDETGTYIKDSSITPIVTHYENGPADYHYAIYKLKDYTPALAKIHGVSDLAEDGPMDYGKLVSLAKEVLGDWCSQK
jgi:poly-gamma-glutamate synthesis protein (capsule biosynthesis protein)